MFSKASYFKADDFYITATSQPPRLVGKIIDGAHCHLW